MSGLQIDTSGRLRAGLERARADQDAARAGLGIAGRDLKRTVTASYYRLLLARHLVQVDRDVLAESQSFEKRSRLLAEHGEVAQADVIKAGAEAAFLEQALNAAELEEKLANHDLASFWTTDVDTPLSVVDVLDDKMAPPETVAGGTPFLGRLEFRVFDAQKRGFVADAKRARADLLPQASVLFQYGIDSTRFTFADRGYASFVHLDIPLFDWFRAPALEVHIKDSAEWASIRKIGFLPLARMTDEEEAFFLQCLETYTNREWRDTKGRTPARYTFATLVDPHEELPPSEISSQSM